MCWDEKDAGPAGRAAIFGGSWSWKLMACHGLLRRASPVGEAIQAGKGTIYGCDLSETCIVVRYLEQNHPFNGLRPRLLSMQSPCQIGIARLAGFRGPIQIQPHGK